MDAHLAEVRDKLEGFYAQAVLCRRLRSMGWVRAGHHARLVEQSEAPRVYGPVIGHWESTVKGEESLSVHTSMWVPTWVRDVASMAGSATPHERRFWLTELCWRDDLLAMLGDIFEAVDRLGGREGHKAICALLRERMPPPPEPVKPKAKKSGLDVIRAYLTKT